MPDNVPDVLAGPANCALSQVIDGLERAASGPGDSLVIQGAGGLGINAIAVAKERGVSQVIVIDGIESRLRAGDRIRRRRHDRPQGIQDARRPACARVRELTDGEGADAVMELVGSPAVVAEGIEMLCSGGVYLEIGNINQRLACEFNPASIVHGGKTILGLMWYQPESLQQALELLSTRAIVIRFTSCSRTSIRCRRSTRPFATRTPAPCIERPCCPGKLSEQDDWELDMARCEQGYLCDVCGDEVARHHRERSVSALCHR